MSTNEPITVAVERADSEDALQLMRQVEAEMHARYPEAPVHGFHPDRVADNRGAFVIARAAGRAIGCAAVRPLEPGVGEVKRMFVEQEYRGRGVGRRILAFLEATALGLGFHTLRLETGERQPEAIRLYESTGYVRIPPWDEYIDDPFSVCYEKRLQ